MSGAYLLGLIGISMASLFAVAGLVINFQVWRAARRAKAGERVASGIPILPGVVGSVTLFFLIPQLKARFGIELDWAAGCSRSSACVAARLRPDDQTAGDDAVEFRAFPERSSE